ncbi:hypothetical protein BTE77_31050 [Ensifer adhaerens]|nr:hypothetical protein BTE77_31050 [Ensifer adhaerens]
MLETERLCLRPITIRDSKNLYHVHRDEAVSRLLCDADKMTRHHSGCLLQRYVEHWKTFGCGFYLVFNNGVPDSLPVGRCGLRMTPEQDVELGYCFTRGQEPPPAADWRPRRRRPSLSIRFEEWRSIRSSPLSDRQTTLRCGCSQS